MNTTPTDDGASSEKKRFTSSLGGVADQLGVPLSTVRSWRDDLECPFLQKRHYDISAIRQWLNEQVRAVIDPNSEIERRKLELEVRKLEREDRVFSRDKLYWLAVAAAGITISSEILQWIKESRAIHETDPLPKIKEAMTMSETSDRRTVVVVDDDHDYKANLERNLNEYVVESWGCRAKKCGICEKDQPFVKAVDFIRSIGAERLAAIVLDVNEFQNDEYSIREILPELKDAPELRNVPVIVYSAKYLPQLSDKAKRAGAVYYYDRAATPLKQAAEIVRKYAL